jgi:tRNA pseudouridine65 synthase
LTLSLRILHRDPHLVAIDKPSGLAVHRGWAAERDVAVDRLHAQLGVFVHPVHRLDRGTSGVLLFALDAVTAREVGDELAAGRVAKRYLALVRGIPPERFEVDHPVPRDDDPSAPRVPAVTAFERLEVIGRYAVVAATPRTGRLHQIRRHLKHISCPILGDVNYGKGPHNRMCRSRYGLHRLFLHAASLGLRRPDGDLLIEAPLAVELEDALRAMRADPPWALPGET